MFSQMKVGTRLALGFGAVVALLLVISLTSVLRLATVHRASVTITDDVYPRVVLAQDMEKAAVEIRRLARDAMLAKTPADAERAWQNLETIRVVNSERMKKLDALETSAKGRELFKNILDRRTALALKYDRQHSFINGDKAQGLEYLSADLGPALKDFIDAAEAFSKFQDEQMQAANLDGAAVYESTRILVIGLSTAAILLAAGLGILITRNLKQVLGGEPAYASEVMKRVAVGDFTVNMAIRDGDRDSLLFNIQQMVISTGQSIGDVVRVRRARSSRRSPGARLAALPSPGRRARPSREMSPSHPSQIETLMSTQRPWTHRKRPITGAFEFRQSHSWSPQCSSI